MLNIESEVDVMIDYLFVSPLGWSQHVWDRLLSFSAFAGSKCDYRTFLDDSFSSITQEQIEADLLKKLGQLTPQGVVIAASYGTVVTLSTLAKYKLSLPRLVLISGLEDVPPLADLAVEFEVGVEERYTDLSDYLSMMLTEEERQDSLLCQILEQNLRIEDTYYRLRLSQAGVKTYLTAYAGTRPQDLLEKVHQNLPNLTIFSEEDLLYPHVKIAPEDHLLMLTKPQVLYQVLVTT